MIPAGDGEGANDCAASVQSRTDRWSRQQKKNKDAGACSPHTVEMCHLQYGHIHLLNQMVYPPN